MSKVTIYYNKKNGYTYHVIDEISLLEDKMIVACFDRINYSFIGVSIVEKIYDEDLSIALCNDNKKLDGLSNHYACLKIIKTDDPRLTSIGRIRTLYNIQEN